MNNCLKRIIFCSLLILNYSLLIGQSVSGYISDMPSVIWLNQPKSTFYWQNLVHNRLNFSWDFAKYFSFEASVRTRFITGSSAMISPAEMGADKGWADLSWNVLSGNDGQTSSLINVAFDRLNFTFEKGKWQVKLGRQRINWGQTFVWNPNDIFNTYSFFDFDYVERPGCDALRTTFFHNATSSSELAVSVNHFSKITAAFMHHWNWKNFDFQVIAGEQIQSDIVVGGAFTGDVKGVNLRGEFSVFQPIKNFKTSIPTVAIAVGADYMFKNSLMLQGEILYNNVRKKNASSGLMSLYSADLSAKTLSICDWNIFLQAQYPLTPRINGSLSAMYFVDINSFYTGFTLDFSLLENLDFSLIAQYFSAPKDNMHIVFGFGRLKYSF